MSKTFEIKDDFYLNNEPVQIISGAMHYVRVVPEYWEDRLLKIKAMGCNTVETYVPWNAHEPEKGEFCFTGMYDLVKFIKLVDKLDLHLILRISPYICAEWEFGGLPYWLLKDKDMRVRSTYEPFMTHVEDYFSEIIPMISEYQIHKNGPIILVQVENEYGYFSNEKSYIKNISELYTKYGIEVPLVTSDSTRASIMNAGKLPEVAMPTVNCGANLKERLSILDEINPGKPKMVMEFWIGWFNIWGHPTQQERPLDPILKDLEDILEMGHVNIYMAHGGTNFGFMNGSNYYEREKDGYFIDEYAPATTSYDYGAPISEDGSLNHRFYSIQKVIHESTGKDIDHTQSLNNAIKGKYDKVTVKQKVSLFSCLDDLSQPTSSSYPLTMEELNQDYGYLLYESEIDAVSEEQSIKLIDVNDRAQVYLNNEWQFSSYLNDFNLKRKLKLNKNEKNNLKILVENMGRVNFGPYMNQQRKGISGAVMLDEYQQTGWTHYPLNMKNIEKVDFDKPYIKGQPAFYQFNLTISDPKDTYMYLPEWGKGVIFVNGFNIGRFWENGPQESYYVPGPLLKEGNNEIIIFESEGKATDTIYFIDELKLKKGE
ncbi:beta-galactosidase [Alkalibacterium iburiense]|uniref:Beta-galactosidase n=1 Tax=Alkalibacterium iburiense TaxID=290589 RepID=A0ABP3HIV1_9LACT